MSDPVRYLVIATAVGCALNGGVFFAFSSFVMPALRRLPATQGIAAMQSINVAAVTPAFMGLLFGTALAGLATGACALAVPERPYSGYLLVGAGLYLVGAIGLTLLLHVPINNRIAELDLAAPRAGKAWASYVRRWTAWNHLRALAGLLSAVALAAGLGPG
jgi:uncharacterized membrane protein